MPSEVVAHEIHSHLLSKGLPPDPAWLTGFLLGQKSSVPTPALKQTAYFRIIQTDITKSIDRERIIEFPVDIHNATVRERRLPGHTLVQVLDIDDIGRSKWSQLEGIEAEERGEMTKGREIIRAVPRDDGEQDARSSFGPHKLRLQDTRGACAYGLEISKVEGVSLSMNIGTKLVLKDIVVARGVVLLESKTVITLGGKIEETHQNWRGCRKATLRTAMQATSAMS